MKLLFFLALIILDAVTVLAAEPSSANVDAFHRYASSVETRLAAQHRMLAGFVQPVSPSSLLNGQLALEHLTPPSDAQLDGAMIHHWRATAFAPRATAGDLDRLLRDFNAYPKRFAPQVTSAHVLSASTDHLLGTMQVRQHHVITVVLDTTYDITFTRPDSTHGYSISRSTRVDELDAHTLHVLTPAGQHGFLWCQNTYWSWREADGGLYFQLESLTLTRDIPTGLAWAVRPYVESIPRDSLEFTLRSAINAIRH